MGKELFGGAPFGRPDDGLGHGARRDRSGAGQLVGMAAAILQGVPATTLDTDIWVDVPERHYLRFIDLSLKLGATMVGQTDDQEFNFRLPDQRVAEGLWQPF